MQKNNSLKILMYMSILIMIMGNFLNYINVLNRDTSTAITYFFIFVPIIISILPILNATINRKKFEYVHELRTGLFVVFSFFIISLYKSYSTGIFVIGTIGELIRLIVPFIYTFILINFFSKQEISILMKVTLLLAWLSFFLSQDFSQISFSNIMRISFTNSYSPFENSGVSMLSYALATYFIYNRRLAKVSCFFSIVLVFLTFKRVYLLATLVLLILSFTKKENITVKPIILYLSSIFFIILTKMYMFILQPSNYNWDLEKLHFDVASFSLYRAYRVWYLIQNNFQSYGFGSTTSSLQLGWLRGATLELDLIKILMELGIIAIVVFVFSYYRLTRENIYAYLVMSFTFLQLLMANGLTNYFEMSILLTTVALTFYNTANTSDDKIIWPLVKFKR